MGLFIPFLLLLLAAAWALIGILLARWLKQAGHTKPFKGREWTGRELYGGGVGFGGATQGSLGGRGGGRERADGLGGFGVGEKKGV